MSVLAQEETFDRAGGDVRPRRRGRSTAQEGTFGRAAGPTCATVGIGWNHVEVFGLEPPHFTRARCYLTNPSDTLKLTCANALVARSHIQYERARERGDLVVESQQGREDAPQVVQGGGIDCTQALL